MIHQKLCMQKIKFYQFIIAILVLSVFSPFCKADASEEFPDHVREAVLETIDKVKPALVRIFIVNVEYNNGREVKNETVGSGVIIDKTGHIITNHHVAGNAKQIVCTLSNKEEVEAVLVSTDPLTDIAVIKIRDKGKKEFPFAEFGDSSLLKAGDRVLAMGSPFALSQSVTMGIVSNTEIVMPKFFWPMNKFKLEGEDVGSMVRWIGHDAPIYSGNSGGPLVNLKGEIIGINEISLGISGAIPGNLAKEVAEQLIKSGKVQRSWFGLEVQPLLEHAEQKKGVLVSGTIEGSPAEKAGFLTGDILLKIDGKGINVRFLEEIPVYNQTIMGIPVGKEVEAVVKRKGKEITLRMTSLEREYLRPKTTELKLWGITARNISLMAAKNMKRDNQDGVLVTTIRTGGPSWNAKPRITAGDVIVKVDSVPVRNVKELLRISDKITKDKTEPVPVVAAFERKKEQYLTVVRLESRQDTIDQGFEVRKPWLAVAMQVLTSDIAEGLGVAGVTGMRVTLVYPGRSAEKAGIKAGDLIIELDGEKIDASSPEDYEVLPAMIRQYRVGASAELSVLRGKETIKITVELEQTPESSDNMKKYIDDNFEFNVRDAAFLDYVREDWGKEQKGVLVESVSGGGWASLARLAVDDLILAVNGSHVTGVASFEKMMENITNEKPESVLFLVKRGIHNLFIELETGW